MPVGARVGDIRDFSIRQRRAGTAGASKAVLDEQASRLKSIVDGQLPALGNVLLGSKHHALLRLVVAVQEVLSGGAGVIDTGRDQEDAQSQASAGLEAVGWVGHSLAQGKWKSRGQACNASKQHVANSPVGSEDGCLLVEVATHVVSMETEIGGLQVRTELVDLVVQGSLVGVEQRLLCKNDGSLLDISRCECAETAEGGILDAEVVVLVLLWELEGLWNVGGW